MKKVRASMRPTMTLTLEDARELRALSADLERELVRSYEDFVFRNDRRIDEKRWRHVKSQEDIHVYRERDSFRHPSNHTSVGSQSGSIHSSSIHSSSSHSRSSHDELTLEIGPQSALAANSKMPLLLGTGTQPGTIEDAVYGTAFFDTRSLRARNMYAKETFEENAVIAVLDSPTNEDPFRFLGVVWYYKVFPIPGLMSNRDIVMLASIHFTQLSNGDRIAVAMYHSIHHRDAPVRSDLSILRADVSAMTVYRQLDPNHYELYISSFVDAKSSSPDALLYLDAARSLLSVTHMCDVALRRKLFYRMREAQKLRQRTMSSSRSATSVTADEQDDSQCAMCSKSFTGLFSPSGSNCQICCKRVCAKCAITKHIVIDSNRTAYTAMPFDFCLVCMLAAKEVPSIMVAREEVNERALAPRNPISSTSSSSASSSVDGSF